jgi:hypothetical protein
MSPPEQRNNIAEQLIDGREYRNAITTLGHQRATLFEEPAEVR